MIAYVHDGGSHCHLCLRPNTEEGAGDGPEDYDHSFPWIEFERPAEAVYFAFFCALKTHGTLIFRWREYTDGGWIVRLTSTLRILQAVSKHSDWCDLAPVNFPYLQDQQEPTDD